jgi:hypothetical protein
MLKLLVAGLTSLSLASPQKLLVTSQSNDSTIPGQIFTLQAATGASGGPQNLSVIQTSTDCGILPTWLDVSLGSGTVLCLDESLSPNLTAMHINPDGSLAVTSKIAVAGGPVSLGAYDSMLGIALAHVTISPLRILQHKNFANFCTSTTLLKFRC